MSRKGNAGRRPLVRKLKHVCWVLVLNENWSLYIVVNPFMIGSHQISFALSCLSFFLWSVGLAKLAKAISEPILGENVPPRGSVRISSAGQWG